MSNQSIMVAASQLIAMLNEVNAEEWVKYISDTAALRDSLHDLNDNTSANEAWFLLTVAEARLGMVLSYSDIIENKYKKSWDELERIEIRIASLIDNPVLSLKDFQVNVLGTMVRQWQSLFPYLIFASPEFVINREECTICGKDAGPWSECEHVIGRVYGGHLCGRTVRDFKFLGVSMVLDPVQKYSAMIPYSKDGKDPLNYQRVAWVAERLPNPFSRWRSVETSKVFPHSRFSNVKPNDICPCSSGMNYGSCCALRDGVLIPHTEIHFSDSIPDDLPTEILVHSAANDIELPTPLDLPLALNNDLTSD